MKNIHTIPQLLVRIFVRPIFPALQWIAIISGAVHAPPRQPYLLGTLSVPFEEAVLHLRKNAFFNHRIAFNDPGQKISMRRLCTDRSGWQYHIRIFDDGEVRGHYEHTPEDSPIQHLQGVGLDAQEEKFLSWVGSIVKH